MTPKLIRRYMRRMQRRSARARWSKLTASERSEQMKKVRTGLKITLTNPQ